MSYCKGMGEVLKVEKDDIVCTCLELTVRDIEDAIKGGATTLDAVMEKTQAGTVCGACIPDLEEIIEKNTAKKEA